MASKEQIYEAAITKWGLKSQLDMLAEECCELAMVALKLTRNNNCRTNDNLAEEIADVELCIEQITRYLILCPQVNNWKEQKLRRLAHLLEE